jgi:hypothetical protein
MMYHAMLGHLVPAYHDWTHQVSKAMIFGLESALSQPSCLHVKRIRKGGYGKIGSGVQGWRLDEDFRSRPISKERR